jgi:hypothetical protein
VASHSSSISAMSTLSYRTPFRYTTPGVSATEGPLLQAKTTATRHSHSPSLTRTTASLSRSMGPRPLLVCSFRFVRWRLVVLCQVIATAEKYVRGYGRKPFNPSRHLTRRNTQENGELLLATLQHCNPRYDALMNNPIHTNPPRKAS